MAFNRDGRAFTEEQLCAIEDHVFYYNCMVEYLNKRKSGESCSLPPKPKRRIDFLEGGVKEKQEFTVEELHNYLERLLVQDRDLPDISQTHVDDFNKLIALEEMIPFLKDGAVLLKLGEKKNIHHALIMGNWLEKAQSMFNKSRSTETWRSFLRTNMNIDDSYARKLMQISKHFYYYPKFHNLSISINELFAKRSLIVKYLEKNNEFRNFWQN